MPHSWDNSDVNTKSELPGASKADTWLVSIWVLCSWLSPPSHAHVELQKKNKENIFHLYLVPHLVTWGPKQIICASQITKDPTDLLLSLPSQGFRNRAQGAVLGNQTFWHLTVFQLFADMFYFLIKIPFLLCKSRYAKSLLWACTLSLYQMLPDIIWVPG